MPQKGSGNLTIPNKILNVVREYINRDDSLYVSMSDFAKEAIREKLERLKELEIHSK